MRALKFTPRGRLSSPIAPRTVKDRTVTRRSGVLDLNTSMGWSVAAYYSQTANRRPQAGWLGTMKLYCLYPVGRQTGYRQSDVSRQQNVFLSTFDRSTDRTLRSPAHTSLPFDFTSHPSIWITWFLFYSSIYIDHLAFFYSYKGPQSLSFFSSIQRLSSSSIFFYP